MQLSDGIRAIGPEALAEALAARPALASPPPSTLGELAERISRPHVVREALERCDAWALVVLHVGAALATPKGTVPVAALAPAMRTRDGKAPEQADVDRALSRLGSLLLAFRAGDVVRLNSGLRAAMGSPLGLGRPAKVLLDGLWDDHLRLLAATLGAVGGRGASGLAAACATAYADPVRLESIIAGLPDEVRRWAADQAWDSPLYELDERVRPGAPRVATPGGALVALGLAIPVGWAGAEIPREVGVVLRHGVVAHGVMLGAPSLDPRPVEQSGVDRLAAGQGAELVKELAAVLGVLGDAPAAALRSGGVGARELGRVAKATGLDIARVALLVELAHAARLLPGGYHAVAPTPGGEAWLTRPPAERWVDVVDAWLRTDRAPSLALRRDGDSDKPRPALDLQLHSRWRALRGAVLAPFHAAGEGRALDGAVADTIGFTRPYGWPGVEVDVAAAVTATLAEADALGVVAGGALGTVARALLDDRRDDALEVARAALPPPAADVVLQADLTAVVDAAAPHRLLHELRLMSDAESSGPVEVRRFSTTSVRRALDAGRSADDVLAFLGEHATTGVPQPLEYLIRDTARRWGLLRTGSATAYLRCDDEALLAEVVGHRRAAKLGLRLLAPTVALSTTTPGKLLVALQDMGFLPAPEGDDGAVLEAAPAFDSAPVRWPREADDDPLPSLDLPGHPTPAPRHAGMASLASRLIDGSRPRAAAEPSAPALDARGHGDGAYDADIDIEIDADIDDVIAVLAEAADGHRPVELSYVDEDDGEEHVIVGRVLALDLASYEVTVAAEPGIRLVIVDLDDVVGVTALAPRSAW